MKRNPSRDVTPIVGLVQLQDGEELGGNNSRVAMQELLEEEDLQFRTGLVSITDNQALRLASKHNLATSVHHEMTSSDKVSVIPFNTIGSVTVTSMASDYYNNNIPNQVHLCQSLRYRMANADMTKDQVPSVNIVMWRSECADILMEKVRGKQLSLVHLLYRMQGKPKN